MPSTNAAPGQPSAAAPGPQHRPELRVPRGAFRAMLIVGLVLLVVAVAGAGWGLSGVAMWSRLADTTVPLSTTWQQTRVVTATGPLTAGVEYGICAGPKTPLHAITVHDGTESNPGESVPVHAVPARDDLPGAFTLSVTECTLIAEFTPASPGEHTIVFARDPVNDFATGIIVAEASAFYDVQPGMDRVTNGFLLAGICLMLGVALTAVAARSLRTRRKAELWLRGEGGRVQG